MTGFGAGTASNEQVKYNVEFKSLNSKFLELNMRLPKTVADQEQALRSACSKRVVRGKVNLQVVVEYSDVTTKAARVNEALFNKYFLELEEIAMRIGVDPDRQMLFQQVLGLPEVVYHEEEAADPTEVALLMEAFDEAFDAFDQFRRDEGTVLKADLSTRAESVLEFLGQVEAEEGDRVPLIRERISQYLDQGVGRQNVDMNRFEQELIYYIDKLDITEEKVRLRSHCEYFIKTLNSEEANGKKLAFISQEIGREINTLGSKANDAKIQQTVIRMKEELEKIKEQLLNVL